MFGSPGAEFLRDVTADSTSAVIALSLVARTYGVVVTVGETSAEQARHELYAVVFVGTMALSTTQALIEFRGPLDAYWGAFGAIAVLSTVKAAAVAYHYQHFRWEPRSVSCLILSGPFVALG